MNFNDVAIAKDEAIYLLRNTYLIERKWNIAKHKNLLSQRKMGKEIISFVILKLKNISYKYFIGYLYDDYKIRPLHLMLPKTSVHCKMLWWSN